MTGNELKTMLVQMGRDIALIDNRITALRMAIENQCQPSPPVEEDRCVRCRSLYADHVEVVRWATGGKVLICPAALYKGQE